MRAPPESLSPMIGDPTFSAISMILQIFSACASESEPQKTVKSWLNAKTSRPSIRPLPVTTPSPGYFCRSRPKSWDRCSTSLSTSSKLFRSSSTSSRSRAVSLPFRCCSSMRADPPPSSAVRFNSRRWRTLSGGFRFDIASLFDDSSADQRFTVVHDDGLTRCDGSLRLVEDDADCSASLVENRRGRCRILISDARVDPQTGGHTGDAHEIEIRCDQPPVQQCVAAPDGDGI